jgi:hypothetical protein
MRTPCRARRSASHRYDEIAAQLDLPVGSIGPIRGRCLARLRRDARLRQVVELWE